MGIVHDRIHAQLYLGYHKKRTRAAQAAEKAKEKDTLVKEDDSLKSVEVGEAKFPVSEVKPAKKSKRTKDSKKANTVK